jgi:serine protease Do
MSPIDVDAASLHDATRAFTVAIESDHGGGAGVIWTTDAGRTVIATCAHVVARDAVRVSLQDGTTSPARVVAKDPWRDTALLAVDGEAGPAAPTAADTPLRAGQIIGAVGHPGGWRDSVAIGVLHSIDRLREDGPVRWLRADVRLWPGNSGGPLVDAHGRVLGLNALVAHGLAHAVPVAAFALLDRVRMNGPVLGVRLRPVELRNGRRARPGLLVMDVNRGARAGLEAGDVLLAAGGHAFDTAADLGVVLEAVTPGETLVLDILRGGERIRTPLRIGQHQREGRAA